MRSLFNVKEGTDNMYAVIYAFYLELLCHSGQEAGTVMMKMPIKSSFGLVFAYVYASKIRSN